MDTISYQITGAKAAVEYRGRSTNAIVIQSRSRWVSLAYEWGGVTYTDTLFLAEGVVLSTLHKDYHGDQTDGPQWPAATTWEIRGCRAGPLR